MTSKLEPLVGIATEVKECFAEGRFNQAHAIPSLERLHALGLELVEQIVRGLRLDLPPLTPVVMVLDEVVALETIQNNGEIHRSLSKTYRLFIELMWRQQLENPFPILDETKDRLISHPAAAATLFRAAAPDVEFEYLCAKTAAKLLAAPAAVWAEAPHVFAEFLEKVSVDRAADLIDSGALEGIELKHLLGAFKTIKVLWQRNHIDLEHFDAHCFRWRALCARSVKDFESCATEAHVEHCRSASESDAINLVLACQDLLQHPHVQGKGLVKAVLRQLEEISRWETTAAKASRCAKRYLAQPAHRSSIQEKMGILPRKAVIALNTPPATPLGHSPNISDILAELLLRNTRHPEQVYRRLIEALPHFTVEQHALLLEPQRLPQWIQATPSLAGEHQRLVIALTQWYRARIEAQERPLDTIRGCQRVVAYLTQAHALAHRPDADLHSDISPIFMHVAHRHFIGNRSFESDFRFALQKNRADLVKEVLDRLKQLQRFCSTAEEYNILLSSYRQLRALFGGLKTVSDPLLVLLREIDNCIETPFTPPQETRTQSYRRHLQHFRDLFSGPAVFCREIQRQTTQAFSKLIEGLLEDAAALIGVPPCEYAFRLLAEAAKEEVEPNSSVRIAFLVPDPFYKEYFDLLAETLKLLLLSIGEFPVDLSFPSVHTCVGLYLAEARVITPDLVDGNALARLHLPHLEELPFCFRQLLGSIDIPKATLHALTAHHKRYTASSASTHSEIAPLFIDLLSDLRLYWGITSTNTLDIIQEMFERELIDEDTHFVWSHVVESLYRHGNGAFVNTERGDRQLDLILRLVLRPLYREIQEILTITKTAPHRFEELVNHLFSRCNLVEIALHQCFRDVDSHAHIGWSHLQHLVRHIASLPLRQHERYYKILSRFDVPGDLLRATYLKHVDPRAVETLLPIATPQGIRQSSLRSDAELLNTLRAFTVAEPTPVKIITSSGETLYLDPRHINTLLDPSGDIRRTYNDTEALHRVSCLSLGEDRGLHFKQKPTHPMMEYAIHSLTSRIAGFLSPATELVRFEVTRGGTTKIYPVLISQTVFGETLRTLREAIPWDALAQLPHAKKQWTWALLCTLLTKPGDGKLNNYIRTAAGEMVCIDNDISFVEPLSEERLSSQVHFTSGLFFALQNAELDEEVLRNFAELNFYAILDGWIEDLIQKEEHYLQLFNESERATLFTEDATNQFKPTLLLREGTLAALGLQCTHLQTLILDHVKEGALIAPLTLLHGLVSLRADGTGLNHVGGKIHKKYAEALRHPFSERLQRAVQRDVTQSMTTLQSNTACYGKPPTLQQIEARRRYALSVAREELPSRLLHQYSAKLALGKVQDRRFIQGSFTSLEDSRHGLALQAYIYYATNHEIKPTTVIIQGCKALRTETLKPFLHPALEYLDISHSPLIKGSDIELIQRTCPNLKELNISHCSGVEFVAVNPTIGSKRNIAFQNLEKLVVSHCKNLTTLKLKAPALKRLIAHDNAQLKEVDLVPLPPRVDFKRSPQAETALFPSLRLRGPSGLAALNAAPGGRDFSRFGALEWRFFFDQKVPELDFPAGIEEILNARCPFWPDKQVKDTHMIVLIPQTVNGRPFSLNLLNELVKRPLGGGNSTQLDEEESWQAAIDEHGPKPSPASHWVLMTKQVLPDSIGKTYREQCSLLEREVSYEVPSLLDAVTCVLLERVKTGAFLYGENPWVRVQEQIEHYRLVFGAFAASGLRVYDDSGDLADGFFGVAALRKF